MAAAKQNSPLAFSVSGEYLAHSSPDGTLKIWETSGAVLSQEYTPSSHLSATCTCINWGPWRESKVKKGGKKKRKSEAAESLQLIALGTVSGDVLLYSVAKGDLHSRLVDEHNDQVNDISWSQGGDRVFSCSNDRHVVEWDITAGKRKSKWKADSKEIYSICLCPGETHILSASRSIKLWDLEKKVVLKTFTGHATEVFQLEFICTSSTFSLNNSYLLSAAVNDRLINVWNLNPSSKEKNSIASFSLPEEPSSINIAPFHEADGIMTLTAVTQNGQLLMFEHVLNGKCKKPLQAKSTVQIATPGSKEDLPRPLPVLGAHILHQEKSSIVIVYGNFLKPAIEKMSTTEFDTEVVLVREDLSRTSVRQESEISKIKTPDSSREVTHLVPGCQVPGLPSKPTVLEGKKRRRKSNELSMDERLVAMGGDKAERSQQRASQPPQADTLVTLLTQGLQSQDKKILNDVLQSRSTKVIKNTVKKLPVPVVIPLVKELARRMQGHANSGQGFIRWIKTVLTVHTSYLMTFPEIVETLSSLYQVMDHRVSMFSRLSRLQGKLELMLSQAAVQDEEEPLAAQQPMLIYQDESSDAEVDEDEEMMQSHSESEDNWEDLSDMEEGDAQQESDMESD